MGTTETKKMRVGVVGCGAISDIYLTNMIHNFENLEVAACCAGHLEHAKKKAEQYGIKGCTYEEILADPSIEMVVILTPACVALTVLVLMQEGKSAGLGSISGAAETYWGRNKGRSMEGMLVKITKILAVFFMLLAVVLNLNVF